MNLMEQLFSITVSEMVSFGSHPNCAVASTARLLKNNISKCRPANMIVTLVSLCPSGTFRGFCHTRPRPILSRHFQSIIHHSPFYSRLYFDRELPTMSLHSLTSWNKISFQTLKILELVKKFFSFYSPMIYCGVQNSPSLVPLLVRAPIYPFFKIYFNPFQSKFSANRILPSSYMFWAGKKLVDYL
jgi:hypothetical protein